MGKKRDKSACELRRTTSVLLCKKKSYPLCQLMCNWVNGNQRQITKKKVNFVLDLDWTQTKSDWNKTERKNRMKKRMENRVEIKTD